MGLHQLYMASRMMAWQVFDYSKKVHQEKKQDLLLRVKVLPSNVVFTSVETSLLTWIPSREFQEPSSPGRRCFRLFRSIRAGSAPLWRRVFLVCFTTKQSPTQLFASSLTKSQSRLITNFSKRENKTRKTDSLSLLCWSFVCLIQLSHDRTLSLRSHIRAVSTDKKRYKKFKVLIFDQTTHKVWKYVEWLEVRASKGLKTLEKADQN